MTKNIMHSLTTALMKGNIGAFVATLESFKNPDDIPEFTGQTFLHLAVLENKSWAVQALLQKGVYPNDLGITGKTPLDFAVARKSDGLALLLRNNGGQESKDLTIAEIHARLEKKYRRCALQKPLDHDRLSLIVQRHPEKERGFVLDYMRGNAGYSPMHDAVIAGDAELLKFWLERGLSPDLPGPQGKTPAHIEWQKEFPNEEILDIIAFYRRKYKGDPREFFLPEPVVDERVIELPADATLDDLRLPQSAMASDTLLYRIARYGDTGAIRDITLASGRNLREEDLLRTTHADKSALALAAERGQAQALLDPRLWKGRREIFKRLLDHLSPDDQTLLKTDDLLLGFDRLTLISAGRKKSGYRL